VRLALTALENISDEAARERRNYLSDDSDPEPVTRTLRRLRHDLVLIGRVAAEPLLPRYESVLRSPWQNLRPSLRNSCAELGGFRQRDPPPALMGSPRRWRALLPKSKRSRRGKTDSLRFALNNCSAILKTSRAERRNSHAFAFRCPKIPSLSVLEYEAGSFSNQAEPELAHRTRLRLRRRLVIDIETRVACLAVAPDRSQAGRRS